MNRVREVKYHSSQMLMQKGPLRRHTLEARRHEVFSIQLAVSCHCVADQRATFCKTGLGWSKASTRSL